MDQTIKIWDLKKGGYEDDPTVIYDHDDEVISADIRPSDSMLASMDIQGTVYIRCIKNLNDAETILQTITSIPKDVEDYAKIIFNSERPEDEGELLVLINDQVIVLDIQGRQIDAAPIQE